MHREVRLRSTLDNSIKNWVDKSADFEISGLGINGIAYIGRPTNGSSVEELRALGLYFIACLIDKTTRYITIAWDQKELFYIDMQDLIDREIQRIDLVEEQLRQEALKPEKIEVWG